MSTHFSARWFPAGGRSAGRRRRGLSARRCPRKALSSARGQKAVGRGRGTPGALRPCCARGRAGPTPPHSGPCRPPAHSPAFLPWGPCPRSRTGRGAGRRQRRAGGRPGRCGLAVTTRLRCSRRLVVPCFSRCSGGEAFEEDLFNWEKNQSGGDGRSGGGRGCWDRARRPGARTEGPLLPVPCSARASRRFHHGDAKDPFFPQCQAELRPFPAEPSFRGAHVLHAMPRCSGRWSRSRGVRRCVRAGGRSGARPPWAPCSPPVGTGRWPARGSRPGLASVPGLGTAWPCHGHGLCTQASGPRGQFTV